MRLVKRSQDKCLTHGRIMKANEGLQGVIMKRSSCARAKPVSFSPFFKSSFLFQSRDS